VKAVVLAAGEGKRLRPLTADRPKCLVELGGRSLLERQVSVLRAAGISDITVVGGYRADQLEGQTWRVVRNEDYAVTNMVATLFCARDTWSSDADLIVCYGDIVYEERVLHALLASRAPIGVVIDRNWRAYWERRMEDPLSDAETLKLDKNGLIVELGKRPRSYKDIEGQYIGLFKVRADCIAPMETRYDTMDHDANYDGQDFLNMYMTSFLQNLIDLGWEVSAVPIDNGWLETDTKADLDLYHAMLLDGSLARFCRLT